MTFNFKPSEERDEIPLGDEDPGPFWCALGKIAIIILILYYVIVERLGFTP
jgi:hypothetical protein